MATNTLFKHLLTLSRSGKRVNFLQALNHYSLLTVSPEAMGPRNVSLLIHSFGNLRLADKEHWRILENYFHSQKEEMNAHDVAVTVWGFAKSSNAIDSSTWKSLEHATRQYLMQFTPKELASICYSFAAIDCKSKLLWDSLRNAVLGQLFYMAPENLPPTVWAFSKIGFKDEKVWSMLERKIFMEIKKLTPTCQSIIIYGFAITENGSDELWSLFEKVFYQNIGDYKDKDIKNIIWSFRKMKRNAGNKLCQDMVNTLKSDFAKYSMGTIVGLGHAIRETTGLTPEFKELLSNSLNDEEKMENLSYGHAASFAKLLFHARIKDDALWDKLALKFKQLIHTTRTFDLKAHMFFTMHNPAYWSFFCEESLILYFEKVFRMDPKVREKSIGTEEYLDVGCLAHHCYSNKLASKMFWTQCSKYLQLKKINVRKTDPGSVAKLMYAFTGRYTDNEVLMGHWFEYADEICNDLKLVETYMKDPKAFRIVMRSFIKVDKFSELLKQIEKLYEACDYREEDLTSLISKTLNWKKEGETREKFPVQKISQVLESYDMEAKKEIMKGIIENWLNIFCEAEYKPRPIYLDLYEKLAKNEDTADSTLKEGEEKVKEEEDGAEEIKQDFEVEAEKLGDIMMGPNDLVFEGPSNNPSENRNRNMPKLMI